jgi:hypothetical protein
VSEFGPDTVAVEAIVIETEPPGGTVTDEGTPAIETETDDVTGPLAGTTVIVVDCVAVPAAPVHESVKVCVVVAVAVSGPMT